MLTAGADLQGSNLYTVGRSGLIESFVIPRGEEASAGAQYSASEQTRDVTIMILLAVLVVGALLFLKR